MHKFNQKKYYFISEYDTNLIANLNKSISIIYRNYTKKIDIKKILEIRNFCKKKGNKFYISNNLKLAINLKLDGVYLPSFNRNLKHLSYSFKKNFKIIGSAHSLYEIKIKETQGVELLFISSIFKKNKNFLGLNRFRKLTSLTKTKIIALGGISDKNLKKLRLINSVGFAGISFFDKKKAP